MGRSLNILQNLELFQGDPGKVQLLDALYQIVVMSGVRGKRFIYTIMKKLFIWIADLGGTYFIT